MLQKKKDFINYDKLEENEPDDLEEYECDEVSEGGIEELEYDEEEY